MRILTALIAALAIGCQSEEATQSSVLVPAQAPPVAPPPVEAPVVKAPLAESPPIDPPPVEAPPVFDRAALEKHRSAAIGRKFSSLNAVNGTEYIDVTIRRIDDLGVSVMHADGVCRLSFDNLGRDWNQLEDPTVDRDSLTAAKKGAEKAWRENVQKAEAARWAKDRSDFEVARESERTARKAAAIAKFERAINYKTERIRANAALISDKQRRSRAIPSVIKNFQSISRKKALLLQDLNLRYRGVSVSLENELQSLAA
jgi:hypothetical protein